ncbi:IucA/IucC family protein [Modicisalibacter radicis]|uniref:IucA/IucC family protein n=1 Tax=Halomonas sp. EAR18 TaxID=2518972 RepID=UPI0014446D0C|nr:IucA/IucC family protein [Halomonas sp. EAR18]
MIHPRFAAIVPSTIAGWHTDAANDLPASCLCNALLRETRRWQHLQSPGGPVIRLPVSAGVLWLRLRHISASGECRFLWPAYFCARDGAAPRPLDFATLLERVLESPALLAPCVAGRRETLRQWMLESHARILDSLAERDDLAHLQFGPLTFVEAEQGLLADQAFHPTSGTGVPSDVEPPRCQGTGQGARVTLAWWAVAPRALASASSRPRAAGELARALLPEALAGDLPAGFTPLPMHPWQARHLRRQPCVRAMEDDCRLVWLGESEAEWHPTSSPHVLYATGAPWMVKGALSSRRSPHLPSEGDAARGLQFDAWLGELDIARRFPGFAVMQEPAWLGWRDACGDTDPESLAVLRENPLVDAADSEMPVLAALVQQPVDQAGLSLLGARLVEIASHHGETLAATARGWFAAYCEQVLTPLFGLLVEDGVVLLADRLSIVLRLDGGWPVGMYYRDGRGRGVTPHFLARHFERIDAPPECLWDRETVRRRFPGHLLVDATLAVTGALAADRLVEESLLLADLRDHLDALRLRLSGDTDCLEHVLGAATLEVENNLFGRLESTGGATPGGHYRPLINPLVADDDALDQPLHLGLHA